MIRCTFESNHQALLRHVTVSALVIQDEKVLFVKRAPHLTEGNKYDLPGGYLDRDETVSLGVAREVLEETGYQVLSTKLFRINDKPDRPKEDKQNVEFIFLVTVGEIIAEHDNESTEVKWFPLRTLPPTEDIAFDHDQTFLWYFRFIKEELPLPIFQ